MLSEVTPTKGLQSQETKGNGILCQIFHFLLVKEFKKLSLKLLSHRCLATKVVTSRTSHFRGTQREYSLKRLQHSIVEGIVVVKRQVYAYFCALKIFLPSDFLGETLPYQKFQPQQSLLKIIGVFFTRGGTAIYGLYRYVPLWVFKQFTLGQGI